MEELIKEVAFKHGIALSKDDPILIIQTINNRLLEDSAKAQAALLEQYEHEIEKIMTKFKKQIFNQEKHLNQDNDNNVTIKKEEIKSYLSNFITQALIEPLAEIKSTQRQIKFSLNLCFISLAIILSIGSISIIAILMK